MRKQTSALEKYREKRKFGVTAEPRGGRIKRGGNAFVIQKHAATRLHYDLRLELDGVMKSWAVTRGPSLVPGEKRLAVHVEDHPIEYNDFEGTIPKGQYGSGTVLIWDHGQWIPEGDPHRGFAKGSLDFTLDGHKLKGRWHLVRMRKRPGERQEPWLLIKSKDEAARGPNEPDILEEKPRSVVSRRTIEGIAKANDAVWQSNRSVGDNMKTLQAGAKTKKARAVSKKAANKSKKKAKSRAQLARTDVLREKPKRAAKGRALPAFVPPQLATLHDKAPNDRSYVHEAKFDGYRLQARLDHGKVKLLTRKALDWTRKFQPVADALSQLEAESAIIDGEVVVEENGVSDFSALQDALKHNKASFVYYAFDLLHLDGADLTAKPLLARKAALKKLLEGTDPNGVVRYSDHFEISGADMLAHACQLDLEGVISKRRDAPYRSGRSDDWIKSKCQQNQEFVILGYKDASHLKGAVGALVLGYYDNGTLKYAGRSGTGYTMETARDVWKKLQPLRRDKPSFGKLPDEERGRKGIWVEPLRVAEVTFRGWTAQGHIRHAVFKGLREDKSAREVVRERPMPTAKPKSARRAKPAKAKSPPRKPPANSVGEGPVKFTHPDRLYWSDVKITKQRLAEYYTSVWDRMAPHVVNRPMALVRCPDGVDGQCFFQKHASAGLDNARIRRKRDGHDEELIYIEDLDGLLTLVQAGVLEIHVWGSSIDDVEHCNRIVFDLDPGDGVPWGGTVKAARELRERLAGLKLKSFVKTTGGKGLHVVLPTGGTPWDEAKDFAHAMVLAMAADSPDRYVTKMTKSIRGGKIFLDYLRNGRGATAIVAYSTRARAGATVSVPVSWDELGPKLAPNKFTVLNIGKRLASLKKDPWAEIGKVKQRLPDLAALKRRS